MIIKETILSIFFLFFYLNLPAQSTSMIPKLSLLPFADDINFPRIQFGLESKINKHYAIYNEFGIRYRASLAEDQQVSINKKYGYKYRLEFRYYLNNPKKPSKKLLQGWYTGANAQYSIYSYNSSAKYRPIEDTSQILKDAYGVRKQVITPNIILGKQFIIWERITIDFFSGIGIRFRTMKLTDQEFKNNLDIFENPSIDITLLSERQKIETIYASKNTHFNLQGGIRIGYAFKNRTNK